MILEQEEVLTWKRERGQAGYLNFAFYLEKEEKEEWEGELSGLMKSINEKVGLDPETVSKN